MCADSREALESVSSAVWCEGESTGKAGGRREGKEKGERRGKEVLLVLLEGRRQGVCTMTRSASTPVDTTPLTGSFTADHTRTHAYASRRCTVPTPCAGWVTCGGWSSGSREARGGEERREERERGGGGGETHLRHKKCGREVPPRATTRGLAQPTDSQLGVHLACRRTVAVVSHHASNASTGYAARPVDSNFSKGWMEAPAAPCQSVALPVFQVFCPPPSQ